MSGPIALAATAAAYARTRWLAWRLRTRADVERHQRRGLARLDRHLRAHVPFYRDIEQTDWPLIDKATLLANFAAMNRPGLSAEAIRAALGRGETMLAGHHIGQSTGTSGNRGQMVISEQERFTWLGTIMAKALPDALWQRHRVALALPGISSLYRSAEGGSRIALGAFELGEGIETWADRLVAFAPDTIVAPPKVLRLLAERGQLTATHLFSGAEVLDPLDRAVIEQRTDRRVREIYMATEGLFGVACPLGTLHLAEDVVRFEWAPVPGSDLVTPVVTDFTRRAQAMVRYRMNDLLLLDDRPCACGSPLQPVRRIEGRMDDLLLIGGRTVTPDVMRNAVVDADARIMDFRVTQVGPAALEARLTPELPDEVDAAVRASLSRMLERLGVSAEVTVLRGLPVPMDRKLRRVMREWHP